MGGKHALLPELSLWNIWNVFGVFWQKFFSVFMVCPLRHSCNKSEELEGALVVNWLNRRYLDAFLSCLGVGAEKKEIYLFTKGLCASMTREWEPDSSAPVALRCDLTTLCQRLPSRLIIWLAALTKMVEPWDQPVTNPYEPTISHPLVWSASI